MRVSRIAPLYPLALLIVAGACADDAPPDAPQGARPDAQPPVERPREDTAARAGSDDDRPVCLQGDRFVDRGTIPLSSEPTSSSARDSDAPRAARVVTGLRWAAHDGCERFVIDLGAADGEPAATPGAVSTEVVRAFGVVRIRLRDVERVSPDATDAAFDGALAGSAYAMRSPDGRWVDVDVHLAGEAEARATVTEEPARVVVDLRPGGGPLPEPAPRSTRVVVLEPRPGRASYPLTVRGYARTFEANVVARLERDGVEVAETFTTATAWADAWGHYELTFEDGPPGAVTLHVGEHSARDGTWEGVAVELEMRDGR